MKKFFYLVCLLVFSPLVVFAKIPNDPGANQWSFSHIKAYEAWDTFTGSNQVVVAVIDNGIDMFHPDLINNIWKNEDEIPRNGLDDDYNGYVDDVWGWNFVATDVNHDGIIDDGEMLGNNDPRPEVDDLDTTEAARNVVSHGTAVAGLIGAEGNNSLGIAGLNWQVKLMNVRIASNNGTGDYTNVARAIRYAVDNGAQIINFSIVILDQPENQAEINDIKEAINYAYGKGVAMFAAAGNEGLYLKDNLRYPICADAGSSEQKIIGVSAVTEKHFLSMFSNYGGDCIDIAAPGENITSTARFSPTNGLNQQYKGDWNGTSFATPLVSGVAALIKGINPEWGAKEIYQAITSTVHHTPGQDEEVYKALFGSGLLQADAAVNYAWQFRHINNNQLAAVDSKSGTLQIIDWPNAQVSSTYQTVALIKADKIFSLTSNGQTNFLVANKQKNSWQFNIYGSDWGFINSWTWNTSTDFAILTGTFTTDKKLQILLLPLTVNNNKVSVYSATGVLQNELTLDPQIQYQGLLRAGDNSTDLFFYGVKDNSTVIERRTINGELLKTLIIPEDFSQMVVLEDLKAGDKFVFSNKETAEPFIYIYDQEGKLLRSFWAYDPSYRGQVGIYNLDLNKDGQEELVTVPLQGNFPWRLWNNQARKIQEISFSTSSKPVVY